ncbi:GNAT family N-acetyltransferase [Nonomuraea roseoviolacea subsp. roseoviolacea]|uniref:GNAT family acetyltransferase n=1 Tax=Nonomuraea roseoviolacea subsp. carminata TaxID=160689 RepID=A0ABT1K322_9ACTN|nr:GNAT family N-acetyltransferase [Nonomuraea roseoviolacea]MCP2348389.1 putative GNAT family acetyltransferase [Nonomuraea roseoviolacea subsp. carminata]
MAIEVVDAPARSRFEVLVDGEVAGFADYRLLPQKIVFTHTEVRPEHEGQGLAGRLVGHALDMSRDTGLRVVPLCSYVARYIERHPEYKDLVDSAES